MGDEQIIKFCLEELTSSAEVYDRQNAILHSANSNREESILAFGKMSDASKRYLFAMDRLTEMGCQPEYDHEHKCYVAKQELL